MPNYSIPSLIDQAASDLKDYLKVEGKRTDTLRRIANTVVQIRAKTKTEDGTPDWAGRSAAYRAHMQAMYEAAGIPTDSQSSVQSALRYHVQEILRKRAPAHELEKAGLKAEGPRASQQARQTANRAPSTLSESLAAAQALLMHADKLPNEDEGHKAELTMILLTCEGLLQHIRDRVLGLPAAGTARSATGRPAAARKPASTGTKANANANAKEPVAA